MSAFDDVSNNGVQIERRGEDVAAVAFAVDGSARAVKSAAEAGAQLLVVHHGISWGGGIRRGVGGLLYLTIDGVPHVPNYDNIGNITRYLDANGNTIAQYTYDAFGKITAQSGQLAHLFRHRFSTKYFDAETGLYYYGYRFYHPPLMRWINRDPIEEEGGLNLYACCSNKAIDDYDTLGAISAKASSKNWLQVGSDKKEDHVWNCAEWLTLGDCSPGGTHTKYIEHFKKYTFTADWRIPSRCANLFAYGIVAVLGMTKYPNSYWCVTLCPFTLWKRNVSQGTEYKVEMHVEVLDRHPCRSEEPEFHESQYEGKDFIYVVR